jgi:hypothetical protein
LGPVSLSGSCHTTPSYSTPASQCLLSSTLTQASYSPLLTACFAVLLLALLHSCLLQLQSFAIAGQLPTKPPRFSASSLPRFLAQSDRSTPTAPRICFHAARYFPTQPVRFRSSQLTLWLSSLLCRVLHQRLPRVRISSWRHIHLWPITIVGLIWELCVRDSKQRFMRLGR